MKNKFQRLLLVLFVCMLVAPFYAQAVERLDKLENVRGDIVFPELTPEQKRLTVEQAQIYIKDLYVHRFVKMDFYPGHEDPVPVIESIVQNVDNMTSEDVILALYYLFTAQRDLHMNYYLPAPYRNYTSFLPLTFTRAVGHGNYFQVRINSVNPELFEEYAPGERIPEVGDEVIFYNGRPVTEVVRSFYSTSMGANEFGGFNRSMDMLNYLRHARYLLPESDYVTMVIRPYRGSRHDAARGRLYETTIPWLTRWTEPGVRYEMREIPTIKPPKYDEAVDDYQLEYNKFLKEYNLEPASAYPENPSNDSEVTWGIIPKNYGDFGYIRLYSFAPDNINFCLNEIRRLLIEELADTDGLIFDVRNNGGGYITLADQLSQLFIPTEAEVLQSRLLNTEMNYRFFNETAYGESNPHWRQVINDAQGTGRTYTDTSYFTTDEKANLLGQAYYKPVVVLNNARSYSSTDMFSCSIQDNKGAVMFGEDPRTGGGGANVISTSFLNWYLPEVFKIQPAGSYFRVAWRQNIRFGDHEGELVEDYGCEADRDVSKTPYDVATGDLWQMNKITWHLFRSSHLPRYWSHVRGTQTSHEVYLGRSELYYDLYVKNTFAIKVFLNDELYQELPVYAYGPNEHLVRVNFPQDLPANEVTRVKFVGVNYNDEIIWNLKRHVIVLDNKVVLDASGFGIDFSVVNDVTPLAIVNQSPPEDGWNLVKPYLQIGYTPYYANYVDTDTILFVDMRNLTTAQLSCDLGFDTELGWDFIEIYVTVDNANPVYLFSGSGVQDLKTFDFDLSAFAGLDNVAIHFRFTSDSNTVAPGVKMANIFIR